MLCLHSDRGHLHHNRTPVARLQMASHLSEHDEICKGNVARAYVAPGVLTVELHACVCTAARLEPHPAPALNNAWLISGLWNRAKLKERLETGEARRPEGENAHASTRTMQILQRRLFLDCLSVCAATSTKKMINQVICELKSLLWLSHSHTYIWVSLTLVHLQRASHWGPWAARGQIKTNK